MRESPAEWALNRGLSLDYLSTEWQAQITADSIRIPVIGMGGAVQFVIVRHFAGQEGFKYEYLPKHCRRGMTLFGVHKALAEIVKYRSLVLVEGFSDCVALHSQGVKNCVAILGSELGPVQAAIINSICDDVLILMDNDDAGTGLKSASAIQEQLDVLGLRTTASVIEGVDPAQAVGAGARMDSIVERLYSLGERYSFLKLSINGQVRAAKERSHGKNIARLSDR